jgi:predicted DNA-binding transcriptional regulator YafY
MLALTTMYPNLLEIDNSYILAKHKNLEAKKREQKKIELNNTASAIKITLRFRESNEGKLSEYYNLDIVSSDENGYYKAYIYIENNDTGYNNLLLHGDKCECIDPIHVRKYLISKIENIAQNYKSGI